MNIQNKYWQDLVQMKFECFYINEYLSHSHRQNNMINILTAITSSSSIAGWAIWNELSFVWGALIAVSQVVNALKPLMPYNKRTQYLNIFSSRLSNLYNRYDYDWLRVSDGSMTEEEINELVHEYRIAYQEAYDEFLLENHLPIKETLRATADQRLEEYFSKYL